MSNDHGDRPAGPAFSAAPLETALRALLVPSMNTGGRERVASDLLPLVLAARVPSIPSVRFVHGAPQVAGETLHCCYEHPGYVTVDVQLRHVPRAFVDFGATTKAVRVVGLPCVARRLLSAGAWSALALTDLELTLNEAGLALELTGALAAAVQPVGDPSGMRAGMPASWGALVNWQIFESAGVARDELEAPARTQLQDELLGLAGEVTDMSRLGEALVELLWSHPERGLWWHDLTPTTQAPLSLDRVGTFIRACLYVPEQAELLVQATRAAGDWPHFGLRLPFVPSEEIAARLPVLRFGSEQRQLLTRALIDALTRRMRHGVGFEIAPDDPGGITD